MKGEGYAVFLNGRFWEYFQSKTSAYAEKKNLKKNFPQDDVSVRKVPAKFLEGDGR